MRAVTRPLADVIDGGEIDLNEVAASAGHLFVRDGVGVAGRGVARRVPVDSAAATLAAIDHDCTVDGVHPVALGSIPFLPATPSNLIIPEVVVGKRADGTAWVTTIDGIDPVEALAAPPPVVATASRYTIEEATPVESYMAAVAAARAAVRSGELTKAVIARPITVHSSQPIDVHAVLQRLRASFGSSYRYSVDGLVGASPELLVLVDGTTVRSHPLAGTTRRTGDPDNDRALASALRASEKNQIEHRVVIDVVHDTLLNWASYLDWQPEPSVIQVANVQHLGTKIEGVLSRPRPNVVELVRALAPTPALGGHPRDEALALIAEHEGFERGRYGGAVGWVDGAGNGTWAVTIRCAEIDPDLHSARLVAGGGIVAESDPHAELAETQAKFQAMLGAMIRP